MGWREEFLLAVRRLTTPQAKSVAGIPLISNPYFTDIRKIVTENTISPQTALKAYLSIEPGPENIYAGEFLSLSKFGLDKVEDHELRDAKVIAIPGLGGAETPGRATQSLTQVKRMFPEAILHSPLREGVGRPTRYSAAMAYYSGEEFIIEDESENFFKKVLEKKFLDKSGKLMPADSVQRFMLLNFSIGCREAKSHINYLVEFLSRRGVEIDEIKNYLKQILVMNIAGPANWPHLPASTSPNILNIMSLVDMGSKKPDGLFRALFLNPDFYSLPESLIKRPHSDSETLLTFSPRVTLNSKLSDSGKLIQNPLGHSLDFYTNALMRHNTSSSLIELQQKFIDYKTTYSDYQKELESHLTTSLTYDDKRVLDVEDVKMLLDSWTDYIIEEQHIKRGLSSSHSSDRDTSTPSTKPFVKEGEAPLCLIDAEKRFKLGVTHD